MTSRLVVAVATRVDSWSPLRQVLTAYVATRLVCTLAILLAAAVQSPAGVRDANPDYLDMLRVWDAKWYRLVADEGYPRELPLARDGSVSFSQWAFFPLFPALVRLVMLTGLPFSVAATTTAAACGAVAAVVLHRLLAVDARTRTERRLAVVGAGLWGLMPAGPVLQLAYTEGLAAALLSGAMLWLLHRRYLLATIPVLLLGLTRAVAAPLLVVVLIHAWRRWHRRADDPFGVAERVRLAVLAAVTGLSALLWPAVAGVVTGRPDAFFATQAAWGQEPLAGPFVAWWTWAYDGAGVVGLLALFGAVAAYLWLVLGAHGRWVVEELRSWAVAYPVYLLAVVRPITSMWRFLLLALPLAALVASLAVRGRSAEGVRADWPVRALALLGLLLVGVLWWALELLTYTPWFDSPP